MSYRGSRKIQDCRVIKRIWVLEKYHILEKFGIMVKDLAPEGKELLVVLK